MLASTTSPTNLCWRKWEDKHWCKACSAWAWIRSAQWLVITNAILLSPLFSVTWSWPLRGKETTWIWSRQTTLSMSPCWRWAAPPSTLTSGALTMTTLPHRKALMVNTAAPCSLSSMFWPWCCVWVIVGWGVHPCQNLGLEVAYNYMEKIIVAHT